jgi:hypothetical protein
MNLNKYQVELSESSHIYLFKKDKVHQIRLGNRDELHHKIIKKLYKNSYHSPIFFSRHSEDIFNEMHKTVAALHDYDVTEELILKNWQPAVSGSCWSGFCKFTLIYLVTGKPNNLPFSFEPKIPELPIENRLSAIEALNEMTGLCHERIILLQKFYSIGMRGDHLRNLHGSGNPTLLHNHCYALEYLIQQNVPIQDAINQVNELTSDEAIHIKEPNNRFEMVF